MGSKREKEHAKKARDTSLGGVLLAAMASIFLGLLLGLYTLASTPVAEVRELPPEEEIKARTVYFVQGQEGGGNSYRAKEAALRAGTPGKIPLNEAELNTWARNNFKFGTPTKPGEEEAGSLVTFKPAAPRFKIDGDDIVLSMNLEVEAFGRKKKFLIHSEGDFRQENGIWKFVPEETYIGSAPLPDAVAAPVLLGRLMKFFESTEQYNQLSPVWNRLDTVEIQDDTLILVQR